MEEAGLFGRTFAPEEDRRGQPVRVAVASHKFWQNRLGGQSTAVGRDINVNGSPYVVIGIAPAWFEGATVGRPPDLWLPMALQAVLLWRSG